MSKKSLNISYLLVAVALPWVLILGAYNTFQKYKDNIQEPFDIAIKYGLIWAFILLGIAAITFILSLSVEKLEGWSRLPIKMSLLTFAFVICIWFLRPENSTVLS